MGNRAAFLQFGITSERAGKVMQANYQKVIKAYLKETNQWEQS